MDKVLNLKFIYLLAKIMPTLLIIDDDNGLRAMLKGEMEFEGFAVSEANSAASAMRLLDAKQFDVIVCDMKMEEEDSGLKLARRMLSPYHPGLNTIFIIFTLHPNFRDCVAAIKAGAYDYLSRLEDDSIAPLIKACRAGLEEKTRWAEDADVAFVRFNWKKLCASYHGQWIAVVGNEVIAHTACLTELYRLLSESFPSARPYIVHVDED